MTLPRTLLWQRLDTTGAEHVLLDDHAGLSARGTMIAADPVPHTCTYLLRTDPGWQTDRLEVSTEGAGWRRTVTLNRTAGRWQVTTSEQGDLDAALRAAGLAPAGLPGSEDPDQLGEALDVDLGDCALTNTLPIRRLGLLPAAAGTSSTIVAAWVLVPSLTVVAAKQTYTVLGQDRIGYASGTFSADLTVDADGYVIHYPGMAERPAAGEPRP